MDQAPPRPATLDEVAEAAEIYISRADLKREQDKTAARRAKAAASQRRSGIVKNIGLIGLTGAVACLGLAIASIASGYRVDVVYVTVRDDGTATNSLAWSSLPESTRGHAALNTLWRYVELREGYHASLQQHSWNVVSALSSPEVRREYQGWAGPENPRAPRRIYGERDAVDVQFTSVAPVCTTDPCNLDSTDQFMIRFRRRERIAGAWGEEVPHYATIRFRRLSDEGRMRLPWWQAATFNLGGIQVWEYPGAKREGVAVAGDVR